MQGLQCCRSSRLKKMRGAYSISFDVSDALVLLFDVWKYILVPEVKNPAFRIFFFFRVNILGTPGSQLEVPGLLRSGCVMHHILKRTRL